MGVVAMLNHETAAKLRQMKLSGMAESYERQMADWQATVAACERGDRARCNAGRQATN